MKILHLTLHREWFDKIASGVKKAEYRERKPYWNNRLEGMRFDEVHFRNGYRPDSPFMRIQCLGISIFDEKRWAIHLGEILEIRNYK